MSRSSKAPIDDAKSRILAAAAALFQGRGVRAVSLDEVAAEAGLTKKTVYYHFTSKDELVAAWLTALSATSGASAAPQKPEAEIMGLFDAVSTVTASPGFRGCPFVATSAELSDDQHPAVVVAQAHKDARRKWFQTRLTALGAKEPVRVASELMLLWDGALASSVLIRDGSPVAAAKRMAKWVLADCRRKVKGPGA